MRSPKRVTVHSLWAAIGTFVFAVASSGDDLLFGKELIDNGGAEADPSAGWSTYDGSLTVTRSNAPLWGKTGDYFFRGPRGTVASSAPIFATMYQSIKVDGASAEIDAGSVAMGIHAMAGGLGSLDNSMEVHVSFRDHADGLVSEKQAEVSTNDRRQHSMLMFLGIKECTVPAQTRNIELTLIFKYGTGFSNDAAIDGVSMKLFTKGDVLFTDNRNMVPFPSAESPAAKCVWESTDLGVAAAFSGAEGPTQYVATIPGRLTTVSRWIDVSSDAIGIDHTARQAMLSASVGGSGFTEESGEVTVQFCDESKNPIGVAPSLSTGTVSTTERSGYAVMYPRSQGTAVPAHTRWVKLELIFHNAASPVGRGAAIDNIDFRIRHIAEMPAPAPAPSDSIFDRELLVNGNADQEASVGWQAPDGVAPAVDRKSSGLMGTIGGSYFRGRSTGPSRVEMFQVVDVSEAGAGIDKGEVAAGLTISLGSVGHIDGTATVTMTSYNASNSVTATAMVKATPEDRADMPRLLAREITSCALPVGARRIEVYIILETSVTDNVAAFDAASLRLLRTAPRPFDLHANLAPSPSAETPAAPCAWSGARLTVTPAIVDGGSGRFQYSSETPGSTIAEHWVNISKEATAIDAEEREAWVSASVGGSGTQDDSGEVTVTFFTDAKRQVGVAPALTTGTVAVHDRVYLAKLTPRSAFLLVPKTARLAKLEMKFENTNVTMTAAIDSVVFRITPVHHSSLQPDTSLAPGESIFDRQLLVNPNADQPVSVGWVAGDGAMMPVRSEEPLKGKQGVSFFRGPKAGADHPDGDVDFTYAGMAQEVSVEAAASEIDAGQVSVGLATLAGGVLSDSGDVFVGVEFLDADWELLGQMNLNVVPNDRYSEAMLIHKSVFRCVLNINTRHLRVDVSFEDAYSAAENGAAADGISLLIQKMLPDPFRLDANLLPHPTVESVASVCAYPHAIDGELRVTPSYPGGDPPYQYSSSNTGVITVVHWIDISADKTAIDLKQRVVTMAASIGGEGAVEDSGELRVMFFDVAKKSIPSGGLLTTGRVTTAERYNKPLLLPRVAQANVPQNTRWLKAELVFHNTGTATGAAIDQLDLRVRHVADGSGAATSAFGRELVVNGEANQNVSVGWKTWDEDFFVERSDVPLTGKDGQYFFRGPLGGDMSADFAEMFQSVSLSEVAEEIKNSHVSVGLSVSAGSVATNEGSTTAILEVYDADDEQINSGYIEVYPSDRSHRAVLVPHQTAICMLSVEASYINVYVSFEYNNGNTNPAAIDSISMKLSQNKPIEFAINRNMLPMSSAEMPGSACAWDDDKLGVTSAYAGAAGRFQYTAVTGGRTVVTRWVDVSSDQAGIDASDGRIASLVARVGGAGIQDNSGRIDVTFCDHLKTPIGVAPALTTGAVTAAQRGFLARLDQRAKPMKVPASTRWLKVELVFNNTPEVTSAALDALDLRILRSADHHKPSPGPEPSGSIFTRELLINGHADDDVTTGWYTTDDEMQVIRSDNYVEGMDGVFYFRGPKGTIDAPATFDVSMEQEVDISEAAADIDAGLLAIGLQGSLGGTVDDDHEVTISAFILDADGNDLSEVYVSRMDGTLVRVGDSVCQISTGARSVRVLVVFSSYYEDNTAAADGISLRLWKKSPLEFADNRNLLQFPSAESPFTLCSWQDEDMNIAVAPAYPGGDGVMQFESFNDGVTRADMWIDLTIDAKVVDALARVAQLEARVGGAAVDDSGEVTVAFFDDHKVLIGDDPAMTTGKVTADQRGGEKRLIDRFVEKKVPMHSRWARVSLLFHNEPDGDWFAAVDMVSFRIRHTPHEVPSKNPNGPLEESELLVNGDADHPMSVGWVSDEAHMYFQRSEVALDGKQGDHFFRGPSADLATTLSMYQRVDISAHAAEIDGGGYAVGLTALLGSVHADDGDVTVSLYLQDEHLGELDSNSEFSDYEVRDEKAKLLPHQVRICEVPSGTRFLEVMVDMDNYGDESPGAVDGMSLRVSKIVAPFTFQQSMNLIPSSTADFPTAACQWDRWDVIAVPSYGGAVGLMHFVTEVYGLTTIDAWIDLAGLDSSASLQGSLSALVGGTTAAEVSGEVRVTFCDKDKAPVGLTPTMTTGVVTAAEREGLPGVRERSATLAVPTGAVWAQVELVFHNDDDSTSAAIDHIAFMIHPRGESAPPVLPSTEPQVSIYDRELLVNGDADEDVAVGWLTHDDSMGVIRSAAPLEAKQGQYFFRGPEGSITHPAGAASMYQVVDIREVAADIAAGHVAAGLTAMVGGLDGTDGVVTWTLEFSDAHGNVLDVTLRSSGPWQRAKEPKLVAEAAQLCKVPADAVTVKVLITFAHDMAGENSAAIDGISMRLVRREPVTFHDGINLAPAPSAEVPASACLWTDGSQLVTRQAFTGANGRFQYQSLDSGRVEVPLRIEVAPDAKPIDHHARYVVLNARIGGSGVLQSSGEVTITFYNKDNNVLGASPAITTGLVDGALRLGRSELLPRKAEAEIPADARSMLLSLVFHSSTTDPVDQGAIDDIDVRVLRKPKVAPVPKPKGPLYNRNLLPNPDAEEPLPGSWDVEGVVRSDAPLNGKLEAFFFRGSQLGEVYMTHTIDISDISADIDAGRVALDLSGMLGGVMGFTGDMALLAEWYDEHSNWLGETRLEVRPADRGWNAKLIAKSQSDCKLPALLRRIEVTASFEHDVAAIDGMALFLTKPMGLPFSLDTNLIPSPSAESPAATCHWEPHTELLEVSPVYPGGSGRFQYRAKRPGSLLVATWVDLSGDMTGIDSGARLASLDALIGGKGFSDDSGEVTVTFYGHDKVTPLGAEPAMTTGQVSSDDRSYDDQLVERHATIAVPHNVRWAKVTLHFANDDWMNGAAIDAIDFQLRETEPVAPPAPGPVAPLEPIFARELLLNGDADHPLTDLTASGWRTSGGSSMEVVRSDEALEGKVGDFFFRGPIAETGAQKSASMYQSVDVSEASAEIDAGIAASGFTGKIGGLDGIDGSVTVRLGFYEAGGVTLINEKEKTVSNWDRNMLAALHPTELSECTVPSGTRVISLHLTFTHTMLSNTAAADHMSLRMVKKEPVTFALMTDLVPAPGAETPAAACLWGSSELRVTAGFTGAHGSFQYQAASNGDSVITSWVDVSSDASAIDADERLLLVGGVIGGDGAGDDSGELRVTFCDETKIPVASADPVTSGRVTALERIWSAMLVPKLVSGKIPKQTHWLKIELLFHNADSFHGASLDAVVVHVLPTPSDSNPAHPARVPSGEVIETELLLNGDAEEDISVGWHALAGNPTRSDESLLGKVGQHFFRGPVGTIASPADHTVTIQQRIDISAAATEIGAGGVAVGISAMMGGLESVGGTAEVNLFLLDGKGTELGFMEMTVSPGDRDEQAMLVAMQTAMCSVPPTTTLLDFRLTLSAATEAVINAGAIDGVSLRLTQMKPVEFVLNRNLVAVPSAEIPAAQCLWEGDEVGHAVAAYDGADGRFQYSAHIGGANTAVQWVRIDPAPVAETGGLIAIGSRRATLRALIGGASTNSDSGVASATFFDESKKALGSGDPELTTGRVSSADRSGATKLLARTAEAELPAVARWAKIEMSFLNGIESATAAVDLIDFRVLPAGAPVRPTGGSSSAVPGASSSAADGPPKAPTKAPTEAPLPGAASSDSPPTDSSAAAGHTGAAGTLPGEIVGAGYRAATQATSGIATVTGLLAGPAAAAQVGQAVGLGAAAMGCGRGSEAGNVAPLWPLSPLQLRLDTSAPGSYYRGAVIGNVILLVVSAAIVSGLVAVLKSVKFSTDSRPWCAAMSVACFPSCLLVPAGLLAPGAAFGAVGALVDGGSGLDYFCAVLALLVVSGSLAPLVTFAFRARALLDPLEFVAAPTPAGLSCLLADGGVWSGAPAPSTQQHRTAMMAALLFRPYRGPLFLWWVPAQLFVSTAVAGAAGAAGNRCLGASVAITLCLAGQAVAAVALRPYVCLIRSVLVAAASTAAAIGAVLFAIAAHRSDAHSFTLASDGMLRSSTVLAIISIVLFLGDGLVGAVKMVLRCRQQDSEQLEADIDRLQVLFGGEEGGDEMSSLGGAMIAKGPAPLAATTALELGVDGAAGVEGAQPDSDSELGLESKQSPPPPAPRAEAAHDTNDDDL